MHHRAWLVVLLAGTGCVSTGKYDEALAESERLREQVGVEARTSAARRGELERLTGELQTRIEITLLPNIDEIVAVP